MTLKVRVAQTNACLILRIQASSDLRSARCLALHNRAGEPRGRLGKPGGVDPPETFRTRPPLLPLAGSAPRRLRTTDMAYKVTKSWDLLSGSAATGLSFARGCSVYGGHVVDAAPRRCPSYT